MLSVDTQQLESLMFLQVDFLRQKSNIQMSDNVNQRCFYSPFFQKDKRFKGFPLNITQISLKPLESCSMTPWTTSDISQAAGDSSTQAQIQLTYILVHLPTFCLRTFTDAGLCSPEVPLSPWGQSSYKKGSYTG